MDTSKEWEILLREHESYSNNELLILFSILNGSPVEKLSGKAYTMEIGIFEFNKDMFDTVSVFPRVIAHAPAESNPYMDAISNEIFCGLVSQFKSIPLLMNQGGGTMKKMVEWRLKIGR
jgi:hypothetical protein